MVLGIFVENATSIYYASEYLFQVVTGGLRAAWKGAIKISTSMKHSQNDDLDRNTEIYPENAESSNPSGWFCESPDETENIHQG